MVGIMSKDKVCYIGHSMNSYDRLKSTSGALFYEIAKRAIIEKDAIVYGAAFVDEFEVSHIKAENLLQLERLRGSKYPQSRIFHLYEEIKSYLVAGRYVVFSGTPCQVYAIKKYLHDTYENLLCIDLICFGVAAPNVWKDYLKYYHKGDIRSVNFKDKKYGWKNWKTAIACNNHIIYLSGLTNLFMSGYMNGTYVRPSCSNCRFKGTNRLSDITIGDAWGKGEQSNLNDDKGLSIFIINTNNGQTCIDAVLGELNYQKVNFNDYIKGNPYYSVIPDFNMKRNTQFLNDLELNGFKKTFNKYCMPHGINRVKYLFMYIKNKQKYSYIERKHD